MRPGLLLAWPLFFLYALWVAALQAWLAAPARLGAWTPDLGLALLFAWAAHLRGGRGVVAALLVALGRAASSAEPPALLAANALAALGLFAGLARGVAIERALPRAALCGLCALGTAFVLVAARSRVLAADGPSVALEGVPLWPGALASAAACLLLAPLLARLPGTAPLARERR
ncbi:MAG TPA: hypothetical protein VF530_22965 [Planctomycetota bacterium]